MRGQRPTGTAGAPAHVDHVDQVEQRASIDDVLAAYNRLAWGGTARRYRGRTPRPAQPNARRQCLRLAAIACHTTPRRVAKAFGRGRPWAVHAVRTVNDALVDAGIA